jgi:hypothetical protein
MATAKTKWNRWETRESGGTNGRKTVPDLLKTGRTRGFEPATLTLGKVVVFAP